MSRPAGHRLAWIALFVVCLCWSTTFLTIKISLETIPPFIMGGVRYISGGAILAAILVARGRALPAKSDWPGLAVLGFFMMVLGNGGVVWGEQFVPSGLTAVIVATNPFWMVGVNALVPPREPLHARQWFGMAVGFFGVVLLVWPEISAGGAGAHGFALGILGVQVACAGWAVGSSYTRRHVMPHDVLGSAALQMVFGGVMMLAIGSVTGEWAAFSLTPRTAVSWIYLALAGSVIGFAAFSYALQHLPVAIVSLYNFVTPVMAVALGTLILGEAFHARMFFAAAVILIGMVIVGRAGADSEPAAG